MKKETGISRGEFLRLAGLAVTGTVLAGCSSSEETPEKLVGGDVAFERETDLLIIGAGGAGLFAAYAANKAGIKPLIVEKSPTFGGDTVLACGVLPTHGTSAMAAQGVEDKTPEEIWEQYKDYFADERVPKLREISFTYATRCVDILTDELGAEWMPFEEGYTYYFHLTKPGMGSMHKLVTPLYNAVVAAGSEVLLETRAISFIVDTENQVVGLRVRDEITKKTTDIRAKRILLATGDFVSNQEMVANYLPQWSLMPCTTYTSMGEGIPMAQAVGASVENMDVPCNFTADNAPIVVWGWYDPLIHVTPAGKRFCNEDHGHEVAGALHETGHYHWYCIFDDQLVNGGRNYSFENLSKLGRITKADSIEELAALINVPADTLAETVANYNAMAEAGEDTEFGRQLAFKPLSAPFYAALATPVRYKSNGGLRINENCQVIDEAGDPIPNLYAAGSCSGTVSPNIGPVIASGLYAGEIIVADLQSA